MGQRSKRVFVDHDACGIGFIAQLGSSGSREVVERALTALERLAHRGGVDADGTSGDGAGLLTLIPEKFIRARAHQAGIELPEKFAVGMAFLPRGRASLARASIEATAAKGGFRCLGWRTVPTDPSMVGPRALDTLPVIQQCFFAPARPAGDLEPLLFLLRKRAETAAPAGTYFCSLSARTIVYKGLLSPWQLPAFYPDLASPKFESPFAVFHQRYSTNTRPSWSLAQPFRLVAHNGEINTISGNRRWMKARAHAIREQLGLPKDVRLLEEGVSDSASFDNGLEVLLRQGHSLASAMLRMAPPAWENDHDLPAELFRWFESQARQQEPWDGPAAMVFSDGCVVGAKLDRNGLRPLRYTLSSDGLLVVASEVGITDLEGKRIVERQRLGPGEMLLADPATGAIFRPRDTAQLVSMNLPEKFVSAPRLMPTSKDGGAPAPELKKTAAALGWTEDQFRMLFQPLVLEGKEAIFCMGDDAPPAFISSLRRSLWDYCKQRFAQVTNPPIDPLRETHVMSLDVYLRSALVLRSPLVDAGQAEVLESELAPVQRIDITFDAALGETGARRALARVRRMARAAAATSAGIVLLSDRAAGPDRAALPALLALAAAWRSMTSAHGCDVPLVIETGQAIDTHHLALLLAAGASAVFPYLALQLAEELKPGGARAYRAAVEAGLRKVLSRMGISALTSYRNSQLFEVVGLDPAVCAEFFEDSNSVLGGKSLRDLLDDCIVRHAAAFGQEPALQDAGLYRFRHNGEHHSTSPELVRRMHRYIKSPNEETYKAFTELNGERQPVTIRDLLEVKPGNPVPLHEVESEAGILSRFSTQAMSLGAISREAHRTLATAMNRLGGRSNTGEGGEDPDLYRHHPEANNRVKQVASGRFGVTAEYLVQADEIEIKMAQGSKPGEGGQLPAKKVSAYIARLRHAVPGMSLISPPPHHDIYSIEDLAQLIYDLRAVNPRARIGVKLVSGAGVGIIAAGVAKAGADIITISGYDGGTGASPLTSIKNTGLPWEVGLRDAHCALLQAGFRRRVRLRVDGGLKFARDVIMAALLGAEEFGFGTAALLAIGCVMARQCHLNTCPVGIATQDEKLRARFTGNPEMIETYFRGLAAEVRELLAAMGAHTLDDIVGAVDRLQPRTRRAERALRDLLAPMGDVRPQSAGPHEQDGRLQRELAVLLDDVDSLQPRRLTITSEDRAVGAHLSGELVRRTGNSALEIGSVDCEFAGYAGQSFGAFLAPGINFRLLGEANDYVGKGLSGGTVTVTAGQEASRRGDVLVGNTVLYGATSGELYVAGRAGERFAVRNSGALAVVEGVGQHGCEYMTAGVVLVLGPAGINFGSGMTGGLAYVLRDSVRAEGYNRQFVRQAPISTQEAAWLRRVLREHFRLTGSPRAAHLVSQMELPLLRIEPVELPCPIAQTWAAAVARLDQRGIPSFAFPDTLPSEGPRLM
jgi:glutamate synthase (ferredoxin)